MREFQTKALAKIRVMVWKKMNEPNHCLARLFAFLSRKLLQDLRELPASKSLKLMFDDRAQPDF